MWEFNVDRVSSTLTGIDDQQSFLFASVWADKMEFSFLGDRTAYEQSAASLADSEVTPVGAGSYLIKDDTLSLHFPIKLEGNDYDVGYIVAGFKLDSLVGQHRETTNRVNTIAAFATGVVLLGIVVYSWIVNRWLAKVAVSITNIAKGELEVHEKLHSPVAEFQDIDLALSQLREDAVQLIELRSKARSEEKIRHMAMHDALTNLANRRYLDEYKLDLFNTWRDPGNETEWLEVLHIDLDGFKRINDSFGHAAGDRILQIASNRLQKHVLDTGLIFRVGGDEFVVIRRHSLFAKDKADIAYAFSAGLTETLRRPYFIEEQQHSISASVGLVIFDGDELDMDTLLSEADIAMYLAKSAGKSRFVDFTKDQRLIHARKKQLADDLDIALESGQIQPYYQPKVNSNDHSLCGAEALIRWNHPELGVLGPDQFLNIVQERGLLVETDRLVFKLVCADIKRCLQSGHRMPTVSVNLSSSRLSDSNLLQDIYDAELDASAISFELLETVYFDEVSDEVLECLKNIRELGVQIELDDFGSGHASMISLLNIFPDRLKIDRHFVHEMLANAQSEKIIGKIVEIGKSLDIPSTAEGVETEQEAKRLSELGCDVLQGYLFGKPCDYETFFKEYIYENNMDSASVTCFSANDDQFWSGTG